MKNKVEPMQNWEQEWKERQRESNRNLSALNQIKDRRFDGGGSKRAPLPSRTADRECD